MKIFSVVQWKIEYRRLLIKHKELISAKYREKHIQRSLKSLFYNFDRCELYVSEIVIKFGACNFEISQFIENSHTVRNPHYQIQIICFKMSQTYLAEKRSVILKLQQEGLNINIPYQKGLIII